MSSSVLTIVMCISPPRVWIAPSIIQERTFITTQTHEQCIDISTIGFVHGTRLIATYNISRCANWELNYIPSGTPRQLQYYTISHRQTNTQTDHFTIRYVLIRENYPHDPWKPSVRAVNDLIGPSSFAILCSNFSVRLYIGFSSALYVITLKNIRFRSV